MEEFLIRVITVLFIVAVLLGIFGLVLDLQLYFKPVSSDLDVAVEEQLKAAKLPGVAMVAIKENQVVFAKGYGLANIEENRPVSPDTVFQIASVSKLVTATTLMRLYEQGKFGLDDDINAYLPFSVRNPTYPDTPITFRMLLAHTSGITDGPSYNATYTIGKSEDPELALEEYLSGYFTPGGEYFDAKKNFSKNAPGTVYDYSNVGFGLVGYLAERIAGKPFGQVCQEEVFIPLGMTSSTWYHRDVDKSVWAMPYSYNILPRTYSPIGAYSFATIPDGALKTSANDFARFLAPFINEGMTLEGQPYLKPETVAEMLRVQYPDSGATNGLAWEINLNKSNSLHTGSDPGISTIAVISPSKHLGLIAFFNGGGAESLGGLRSTFGFQRFIKNVFPIWLDHIR
ncbi:MAG: serine hydrolase [Anaerolineaceae bacterium]|nr:serine hydrolase [Anaerolineaceae bacterium]